MLWKLKVIGQTKDCNGSIIGSYNPNPFLNTLIYDVEFSDGNIKEYSANVIVENIYLQVDKNGYYT